ncbi:NAD(P)H-hydrate dehydratase [Flavobacterium sp. 3HN19-14]|uniref:NAD(P)H-hydrate dehydratase n=1 Tax=Flavobacterium sp. 3HN19-14 TaxID=3448133 RepID=UPI003EDF6FD8
MKKPVKITKAKIQKIYKPAAANAHKGTHGQALLIGGSYGKIGAVCLSSKAALQSGCGLVTAFLPKCGYEIIQTAIPEVMAITDKNQNEISKIKFNIITQAIGISPGIGQKRSTAKALHKFLKSNKTPLVIDADALNILSENKEWLSLLQPKTILTPHPKELERLIGKSASEIEKFEKANAFATKHKIIIVMKDAPTFITDGENIYENTTGNAALATAGSGDVLTGIITGLLAQSYEPIAAATLAVYLHGLSADIALPETGTESFIASDILKYLGKAYLSLK